MNQWMFWTLYVHAYIWLKNKCFLLWVYNDFSYDYCKFLFHNFAFFTSSAIAYPAYHTREMVDLWPKERGGFCTWNNSYRQAYTGWLKRYGFTYYIALWMADNLGMMSNCNEAYNSLETIFPIFAEST